MIRYALFFAQVLLLIRENASIMRRFLLLLLSFSINISGFAQSNAIELKSASFAARMTKNYRQAGELFEQALKQPGAQASAGEFFNAARNWARAGEATNAFRNLDRAIREGWDNLAQLRMDDDLADLQTDRRWPLLMRKARAAVARTEANYNLSLKRELEAMLESDQGARRAIGPIQQRYGLKSTQLDSLYRQMELCDAQNVARVTAIVAQYGWPGTHLVGRNGSMAAFLVIQHADLVKIQEYLPLIRKEAEAGVLAKRQLALMEDRVLVYQDKPQLYGSQVRTNAVTGKAEFYPIQDEARVDERRASVGMEPLVYYAALVGVDYVPVK